MLELCFCFFSLSSAWTAEPFMSISGEQITVLPLEVTCVVRQGDGGGQGVTWVCIGGLAVRHVPQCVLWRVTVRSGCPSANTHQEVHSHSRPASWVTLQLMLRLHWHGSCVVNGQREPPVCLWNQVMAPENLKMLCYMKEARKKKSTSYNPLYMKFKIRGVYPWHLRRTWTTFGVVIRLTDKRSFYVI